MKTEKQHKNIVRLSDIRQDKLRALSPYGPVRAGLTTLPRTNEDQVLMELLSSLERKIADLNSKSLEVFNILNTATEEIRALPSDIIEPKDGIDESPTSV